MPRAATIQVSFNCCLIKLPDKVHPQVVSDNGGKLWGMDRATFRRIVLKNAFLKRKMYENLLETVPLLSSLSVGIIVFC